MRQTIGAAGTLKRDGGFGTKQGVLLVLSWRGKQPTAESTYVTLARTRQAGRGLTKVRAIGAVGPLAAMAVFKPTGHGYCPARCGEIPVAAESAYGTLARRPKQPREGKMAAVVTAAIIRPRVIITLTNLFGSRR